MLRFILIVLPISVCCINAQFNAQLVWSTANGESCYPNSYFYWWTCANPATCQSPEPKACQQVLQPGCMCCQGFVLDNNGYCIHPSQCPNGNGYKGYHVEKPMEQPERDEKDVEAAKGELKQLAELLKKRLQNPNNGMNTNQMRMRNGRLRSSPLDKWNAMLNSFLFMGDMPNSKPNYPNQFHIQPSQSQHFSISV